MKKQIIKPVVLLTLFLVAVVFFSVITNKDNKDLTTTLSEATLPVVEFYEGDTAVNELHGYVTKMDSTAMRDTITPLESNGTLQAEIAENGNKISKISYKVYSLDGADTYAEGKVKEEDGKVTLELGTSF